MFQGFGERMPDELTASALYTMRIKVICPPEGKDSVWEEQTHFTLSGASLRRNTTWTFSSQAKSDVHCQRCSHGGSSTGSAFD